MSSSIAVAFATTTEDGDDDDDGGGGGGSNSSALAEDGAPPPPSSPSLLFIIRAKARSFRAATTASDRHECRSCLLILSFPTFEGEEGRRYYL
jgi:hypothetical protein